MPAAPIHSRASSCGNSGSHVARTAHITGNGTPNRARARAQLRIYSDALHAVLAARRRAAETRSPDRHPAAERIAATLPEEPVGAALCCPGASRDGDVDNGTHAAGGIKKGGWPTTTVCSNHTAAAAAATRCNQGVCGRRRRGCVMDVDNVCRQRPPEQVATKPTPSACWGRHAPFRQRVPTQQPPPHRHGPHQSQGMPVR
mmetsp:Transcript_42887/g.133916  ORF Transcript_42887/g.133916 Transcript_42887/m.133916 type:complete len:201 (-) Transcript_42887:484-1086(-)